MSSPVSISPRTHRSAADHSLFLSTENREIHQTIPDHRVKLTSDGWQQAYDAGHRLRNMLRADDTLHFFTSPYRRTRETTEGILATLTSDDPEPSPFKRNNIKVYEEPRLREQDFGNFQPCSAEMERMWQERADYGHFFYRIPNGESAADAYDRISGFNESLWRQFGDDDFASVCVLGKWQSIVFQVSIISFQAADVVEYSHPRFDVPSIPHEVVPLQRRVL